MDRQRKLGMHNFLIKLYIVCLKLISCRWFWKMLMDLFFELNRIDTLLYSQIKRTYVNGTGVVNDRVMRNFEVK